MLQMVHDVALGSDDEHRNDLGDAMHPLSMEGTTLSVYAPICLLITLFWTCRHQKLMNHDPRMLQMVHDVALGGNDDIEMI